jgi:hypothetical protein
VSRFDDAFVGREQARQTLSLGATLVSLCIVLPPLVEVTPAWGTGHDRLTGGLWRRPRDRDSQFDPPANALEGRHQRLASALEQLTKGVLVRQPRWKADGQAQPGRESLLGQAVVRQQVVSAQ